MEPQGKVRPGTTVVLVVLLLGGLTAAHQILSPPGFGRWDLLGSSLTYALQFRMPGVAVGAMVVAGLRPKRGLPDWRERAARMVGWIWIANVGLAITSGLLFG